MTSMTTEHRMKVGYSHETVMCTCGLPWNDCLNDRAKVMRLAWVPVKRIGAKHAVSELELRYPVRPGPGAAVTAVLEKLIRFRHDEDYLPVGPLKVEAYADQWAIPGWAVPIKDKDAEWPRVEDGGGDGVVLCWVPVDLTEAAARELDRVAARMELRTEVLRGLGVL